MRALLTAHVFRADLMAQAFAINITLIVLAIFAFLAYLRAARRHGTLLQGSE
jgi:ABC-2 type transport system permease protein